MVSCIQNNRLIDYFKNPIQNQITLTDFSFRQTRGFDGERGVRALQLIRSGTFVREFEGNMLSKAECEDMADV